MHRHSLPRALPLAALLSVAFLPLATPAAAWFTVGHAKVARCAVRILPPDVPQFFRDGSFAVGEAAVDPDLFKDKTLAALRAAEDPQHFLDWELIAGLPLPDDRWTFTTAVIERKVDPKNVGVLPYALLEAVQRLTIAFAEYRRYPNSAEIQQKALVYAGWMAHYAGDLEQPLHTSIHHDGRALPDKSSPHTGIHQLVDGLFERVPLDDDVLTRDLPVQVYSDFWTAIHAELTRSHALVDRVYELEPDLRRAFPPTPAPSPATTPADTTATPTPPPEAAPPPAAPPIPPAVATFTTERYRATASFLASLFRSAWERSATIKLPVWLERYDPS